jgi:hypothetical protein
MPEPDVPAEDVPAEDVPEVEDDESGARRRIGRSGSELAGGGGGVFEELTWSPSEFGARRNTGLSLLYVPLEELLG